MLNKISRFIDRHPVVLLLIIMGVYLFASHLEGQWVVEHGRP